MPIKKIAVCTDFSENANAAFTKSLEMARTFKAKLFILHVIPPVVNPVFSDFDTVTYAHPDKSMLLKAEERMTEDYSAMIEEDLDHELVLLDGHVSTEILNFLEKKSIDLVLTGAYGLTGMGLVVFGSVAKRISHKAPCSVMIVR
jgi:universal stress protein A